MLSFTITSYYVYTIPLLNSLEAQTITHLGPLQCVYMNVRTKTKPVELVYNKFESLYFVSLSNQSYFTTHYNSYGIDYMANVVTA